MESPKTYRVVKNHEEQYATIPTTWPVPAGWTPVGVEGDEATCTAYVDQHWTDMRPLSLRRRMNG